MLSTLKRHLLAFIEFLKIQDPDRVYGPSILRTSEHTPSVYHKVVRISDPPENKAAAEVRKGETEVSDQHPAPKNPSES